MIVLRRCLSTRSSGGQSIGRRKREVPKCVPFKSDVSAEATRRSVGSKEPRTVRLSPTSKPVIDKANGVGLRSVRKTKRMESINQDATIKAIGGRINRRAIDSESKKSIGGSIAVTLSATAKHRKEKNSSREALSNGEGNVINPSTLSIPIAPSQIVAEKTGPKSAESISQSNPVDKKLNSNSSGISYAAPVIAVLGATSYFFLQKDEVNVKKEMTIQKS